MSWVCGCQGYINCSSRNALRKTAPNCNNKWILLPARRSVYGKGGLSCYLSSRPVWSKKPAGVCNSNKYNNPFSRLLTLFWKMKEGLWDHLVITLCIHSCLSICPCISRNFVRGILEHLPSVCLHVPQFLGTLWDLLVGCVSLCPSYCS
jgi:hypothetical protein